jgi:serine/threonine protein kinase
MEDDLEAAVEQTFENQLFKNQFQIHDLLHDIGAHSFIFTASSTETGEKHILKIIKPDLPETRIKHELNITRELTGLQSPFLVPCVSVEQVSIPYNEFSLETVAIIMPAFLDGDLFDYVRQSHSTQHPERAGLQEFEIRVLGRDMIQSLIILHKHRFVHNDIKPENFLVTTRDDHKVVALCDYGMVMQMDEKGLVCGDPVMTGTPAYRAPELVNLDESWTSAVDLWALGCTFFYMFTGKMAFTGRPSGKSWILKGEMDSVIHQLNPSRDFLDLLRRLICVDCETIMTIHDVVQHPFFDDNRAIKQTVMSTLPDDSDYSPGQVE